MIVPWRPEFRLGQGYSTDSNTPRTDAVAIEQPVVQRPGSGVEIRYYLVGGSTRYAKVLEAGSSAGLSFSGSVETSFDSLLSKKLATTSSTLHMVILAKHTSSAPQRLGGTLQPYSKQKLLQEGPKAFHDMFGDRYIAGSSFGGRFVGIYTMTFNTAEQCAAAKASLGSRVSELGSAGFSFNAAMQQEKYQFTSESSVVTYGWVGKQYPKTLTPEDLYQAAGEMDPTQGDRLSALLCLYTDLLDYNATLDEYKRSHSSWLQRRGLPLWNPPIYEETHSIAEARQLLGEESAKLLYLQQLLAAEKGACADKEGLRCLEDQVRSLKSNMGDTFGQRVNLEALAQWVRYGAEPDPETAADAQWQLGKKLREEFFLADTLEASVVELLPKAAGDQVEETGWLGFLSPGTVKCVELNGANDLVFQCVVPAAPASKGFAISHMDGAATNPIWGVMGRSSGARIAARVGAAAMLPYYVAYLWVRRVRGTLSGLWSDMKDQTVPGLNNVTQVKVQRGWARVDFGDPRQVVLQITFCLAGGREVKVPDCPEFKLFKTSSTETLVIPPEGKSGTVIAVLGLGNALMFRYKKAPTTQ